MAFDFEYLVWKYDLSTAFVIGYDLEALHAFRELGLKVGGCVSDCKQAQAIPIGFNVFRHDFTKIVHLSEKPDLILSRRKTVKTNSLVKFMKGAVKAIVVPPPYTDWVNNFKGKGFRARYDAFAHLGLSVFSRCKGRNEPGVKE